MAVVIKLSGCNVINGQSGVSRQGADIAASEQLIDGIVISLYIKRVLPGGCISMREGDAWPVCLAND
jgi:hypothetical protein